METSRPRELVLECPTSELWDSKLFAEPKGTVPQNSLGLSNTSAPLLEAGVDIGVFTGNSPPGQPMLSCTDRGLPKLKPIPGFLVEEGE